MVHPFLYATCYEHNFVHELWGPSEYLKKMLQLFKIFHLGSSSKYHFDVSCPRLKFHFGISKIV